MNFRSLSRTLDVSYIYDNMSHGLPIIKIDPEARTQAVPLEQLERLGYLPQYEIDAYEAHIKMRPISSFVINVSLSTAQIGKYHASTNYSRKDVANVLLL